MKKIAQGIVRFRKLILTVAFLLLIPSAIGAVATRINYDILTYLPQDLDSMIGEVALEDDFHLASTGMITVEGLPTNELIAMKKDIEAVPGVMQTFWLSDVIDPSIPTEMLPADVQQFMFGKNDSTMLIVRFDAPSASDETMNAVSQIEKLLRKDCFFGGMSVILQDTKALVNQEMPLYILIAVGAILRCYNRDFHLHGFQYKNSISCFYSGACCCFDFADFTRYRSSNLYAACCACRSCCFRCCRCCFWCRCCFCCADNWSCACCGSFFYSYVIYISVYGNGVVFH